MRWRCLMDLLLIRHQMKNDFLPFEMHRGNIKLSRNIFDNPYDVCPWEWCGLTPRDSRSALDATYRGLIGLRAKMHPSEDDYIACERANWHGKDICPRPSYILYAAREGNKLTYNVWKNNTETTYECDGDKCKEVEQ